MPIFTLNPAEIAHFQAALPIAGVYRQFRDIDAPIAAYIDPHQPC